MSLLFRARPRTLLVPKISSSKRYSSTPARTIDAKYLSLLRTRIGKCIGFGLPSEQFDRAGAALRVLALEWRELLAGSEGFLVPKERGGGWRRKVEWGDMVSSMCCEVCYAAWM